MTITKLIAVAVALFVLASAAHASIEVTEWMYKGEGGEFFELTNIGASSVDFTGYSFDDDHAVPGTFDLSAFGVVAAGESVIVTEDDASVFRTAWGLDASVKVIGLLDDPANNIGSSDTINIYDALSSVVESLAYDSDDVKTNGQSCTVPYADLASATSKSTWTLATVGDAYGSWASTNGDIGNPGVYNAVPEPASIIALGTGLVGIVGFARRKK